MSSFGQGQQDKTKSIDEYLKKADIILDNRFLYFAFSCLGKNVEVQLKDRSKGQGKLYTCEFDAGGIALKNFHESGKVNEGTTTKVLTTNDFVYMLVADVEEPPLMSSTKDVFKTDAEISKNKTLDQRKLVKYEF